MCARVRFQCAQRFKAPSSPIDEYMTRFARRETRNDPHFTIKGGLRGVINVSNYVISHEA